MTYKYIYKRPQLDDGENRRNPENPSDVSGVNRGAERKEGKRREMMKEWEKERERKKMKRGPEEGGNTNSCSLLASHPAGGNIRTWIFFLSFASPPPSPPPPSEQWKPNPRKEAKRGGGSGRCIHPNG